MSQASATTATPAASTRVLAGRVVLVVGAHGGLGRAAAIAIAEAGAHAVLLGRKVPKLNRVYDAIASRAGDGLPEPANYPFDLEGATPDDHAALAERIATGFGRLDGVLFCAAEFRGLTPLEHSDPAAIARAIHVNLTAKVWLAQACLPLLKTANDGAIVFALDDTVRTSGAYWGGYGLAQAGTAALVSMLHAELANSGVRVSALQPGPMRTGLRAMACVEEDDRRAVDPSRYAGACVTLLSAAGSRHRGQVWTPSP
ncbi:MAG: SDR family NAD(P)-dependent oxidoreductase [Luteimonas sp.]